jgi:hypothetical protein
MTELEVFKQSLDVSRITLLVSLAVSTVSIVFGSLEMAFQRSHNKHSVRPFCVAYARVEGNRVAINLRNVGLGPLFVTGISYEEGGLTLEGQASFSLDDAPVIPPLERWELGPSLAAKVGEEDCRELLVHYKDIYDRKYEKRFKLQIILDARTSVA